MERRPHLRRGVEDDNRRDLNTVGSKDNRRSNRGGTDDQAAVGRALGGGVGGECVSEICFDVFHRPTIDSPSDDCFDDFDEPLSLSLGFSSSTSVCHRHCDRCPHVREDSSGVFLLSSLASAFPLHSVRRPSADEHRDDVLPLVVEAVSSASASASPSCLWAVAVLFWSSG